MSLFFTNQTLHSVNINPLKLETPLGSCAFQCRVNDHFINIDSFSVVKSTKTNTFLASWSSEKYLIEFLRVPLDPNLSFNVAVDKCFAAMWRIKVFKNSSINLSCCLDTSLSGYSETGEHLIAQSFENKSIKLSIGTEDEEKLEYRAKNNNWFPYHFEEEIDADNIRCLNNCIEVDFPRLFKNDQIQIQFLIAWSSKIDRDISTWYAVEQSPVEILKKAGFY